MKIPFRRKWLFLFLFYLKCTLTQSQYNDNLDLDYTYHYKLNSDARKPHSTRQSKYGRHTGLSTNASTSWHRVKGSDSVYRRPSELPTFLTASPSNKRFEHRPAPAPTASRAEAYTYNRFGFSVPLDVENENRRGDSSKKLGAVTGYYSARPPKPPGRQPQSIADTLFAAGSSLDGYYSTLGLSPNDPLLNQMLDTSYPHDDGLDIRQRLLIYKLLYPNNNTATGVKDEARQLAVIPQNCWHGGKMFGCGLSVSCILQGSKPMDLCNGGMIWSCCIPKLSPPIVGTYGTNDIPDPNPQSSAVSTSASTSSFSYYDPYRPPAVNPGNTYHEDKYRPIASSRNRTSIFFTTTPQPSTTTKRSSSHYLDSTRPYPLYPGDTIKPKPPAVYHPRPTVDFYPAPPKPTVDFYPTRRPLKPKPTIDLYPITHAPQKPTPSFSDIPFNDLPAQNKECGQIYTRSNRIVGGNDAAFGRAPWQVAIFKHNYFATAKRIACGGALISPSWVVTASHCVFSTPLANLRVRLGEYNIQSMTERFPHEDFSVERREVHPDYNPADFQNDIALLKLSRPVQFKEHIIPVCIPRRDQSFEGKTATVVGWGRTKHGFSLTPTLLQEVEVEVFSQKYCQSMFRDAGRKETIHDVFLCAGKKEGGADSCQGDSGGPLTTEVDGQFTLVGLVSWGIGCGKEKLPGVYTNIARFSNWISRYATS